MSGGKFIIIGVKEQMRTLQRMGADVGGDAYAALDKAGQNFENKIKVRLSDRWGARTGKEYPTGKKGERFATHQASAPGEPPAKQFGYLMGSITHGTERLGKGGAIGAVGTNDESAEALERGRSNMAPRPFIFPTLVEEAESTKKIISRSLHQALLRYRKK